MISDIDNLLHRRTADGKWMQGCEHTTVLLNHKKRNSFIKQATINLKNTHEKFDTIVCCGTSGLLVVPQIAEALGKNILIIRKKYESKYSPFLYEGVIPEKYIIVDYLICSGSTVKHILKTVRDESPNSICVGVYVFLKDKCCYRNDNTLCKRDLGIQYL